MTEEKKQPKKRIQLVDVVLERKGSQMFEGRRVRSPEDAANIIRDFIGDSDRDIMHRVHTQFTTIHKNSYSEFR